MTKLTPMDFHEWKARKRAWVHPHFDSERFSPAEATRMLEERKRFDAAFFLEHAQAGSDFYKLGEIRAGLADLQAEDQARLNRAIQRAEQEKRQQALDAERLMARVRIGAITEVRPGVIDSTVSSILKDARQFLRED